MEGVATGIGRCSIVAKVALEPAQRIYAGICGRCDVPDNRDDGEHLDAQISSRSAVRRSHSSAARVGLRRDEKYLSLLRR